MTYINPRRQHFVVETYDAEGNWISYRVNSESDLETVTPPVRSNFDRIMSGRPA